MKKSYYSLLFSLCLTCSLPTYATVTSVSTDTLYYVDFNTKPGTFTTGDIYKAATGNANKETTVNTITFGAGPNGQRINMNTTIAANKYGSGADKYISATADDDGANAGAFSFLTTGSGSAAGGYLILPQIQGSANITVWSCGADSKKTQSYKIETSTDGGTTWNSSGTCSMTDYKLIHKNIFTYTGTVPALIKLTCTTASSSNCNLYIFDILVTQRPSLVRTSATGTDSQIITIGESLTNLIYTYGGDASSTTLSWTGTANASTPPDGVTVTPDATAKTVTIAGTPTNTGSYGLSITSTYTSKDGNSTVTTDPLTASFTVNKLEPLIELTSASGTAAQSLLIEDPMTDVQYTWRGSATGASITWTGTSDATTAPAGITVTTDNTSETLTITGTPTAAGTYGWSVTSTDGTDTSTALTGTLAVQALPTISLTSAATTNAQTILIGDAITDTQYIWKNSATGVAITWTGTADASTPPDGITVATNATAKTVTITGTPSTVGTYGWSIASVDGINTSTALSGTLTVLILPTVSFTSATGTDAQSVSFFQKITDIGYSYGGSATSATVTWKGTIGSTYPPAGVTVTTDATVKTVTISGAPMITGTYKYTITAMYNTRSMTTLTGTITVITSSTMLPSFPEAVGYGAHATGGRSGSVYHVTTLDDNGEITSTNPLVPGTFRDAVSASNRIIVFDVGGYINLKAAVSCKSNLTIAGQTAPGGIAFSGGEISFAKSSNIICRHIRVRLGSTTAAYDDNALSLYVANNVILDHCSFEFAPYNNIDGVYDGDKNPNRPVTGITFQNCLIADPEGIKNTGWKLAGQQFGAHCESTISQWTFYQNIFANSHNRNPLAKINENFINNVLYNCSAGYTTHTSTEFSHDLVNNYFVMGPASTDTDNQWFQVDNNQNFYLSGNLKDSNCNSTLDGSTTTPYWYQGDPGGTVLTSPWSELTATISTYDTPSAFRINASITGAFPYDQMDSLIISQVRTTGAGTASLTGGPGPGSSLYNSQIDTGLGNNGFGVITAGTKQTDTDNDGMPDYWESANGSDINTDDALTIASDGYTLIEHYLNWLAEPHAVVSSNKGYVDVDLASYTGGFANVSPSFTINNITNGSASLQSDGHTVRYIPTTGFTGLGGFRFTVTGTDGTSYASPISILSTSTAIVTALHETQSKSLAKIYPNPVKNVLTVEGASYSAYSIVDELGKVVAMGTGDESLSSQTIHVADLSTGIYFLKLTNAQNNTMVRFVKQ
jgi:hypothetical protein